MHRSDRWPFRLHSLSSTCSPAAGSERSDVMSFVARVAKTTVGSRGRFSRLRSLSIMKTAADQPRWHCGLITALVSLRPVTPEVASSPRLRLPPHAHPPSHFAGEAHLRDAT